MRTSIAAFQWAKENGKLNLSDEEITAAFDAAFPKAGKASTRAYTPKAYTILLREGEEILGSVTGEDSDRAYSNALRFAVENDLLRDSVVMVPIVSEDWAGHAVTAGAPARGRKPGSVVTPDLSKVSVAALQAALAAHSAG